jgi:hypothetical protein
MIMEIGDSAECHHHQILNKIERTKRLQIKRPGFHPIIFYWIYFKVIFSGHPLVEGQLEDFSLR